MTTVELYTKGARVWITHPEHVWEGAELLDDYIAGAKVLRLRIDADGEERKIQMKSEADLPFLRNPAILIGENDLTSLSYLHEPAVLHNLKVRFCEGNDIYTYCGIVLVAVNPYEELDIYGNDRIQTYRGQAMGDLDPHIFAVAEEAYTKLEREQRDQSIIVSGESGAGKTVSAKYTMRYFATVGGNNDTETQIESKVLASSPIMEAVGNAKTTRNDNSSRFGKFIELQFNKQFNISGASMRTYLLEKSRVVFQSSEERNYHIFYQLCAAHKRLPHLHLDEASKFHYLNQGGNMFVDGVDDLRTYEETVHAMNLLGFSESEQDNMFKIYAAILHLGNITFVESIISQENEPDQEGVQIKSTDKHLGYLADLLRIDVEEIRQWLCIKKLTSMREVFLKPMSLEQATVSRDALAKRIYAELFDWIVVKINRVLESDVPRYKFIGVLDIYGFETFEINSFEQFCINYANEKLQQQFSMHVFKLEQDEYVKEGIEWTRIDFYDNQPCIDLIEAKLGILDLLDEECRMPKGTDSSWTEKLYSKCISYKNFAKPRFGTSAFKIVHFADEVEYESSGFLEKNRDTVVEEQIDVVRNSANKLVKKLFNPKTDQLDVGSKIKIKVSAAKPQSTAHKTHTKTVGSQFRDSLSKLMATLNVTTPHYVRCIKPNDTKSSFEYNPQRAVQQLRACGVLETIRISAAGFPSRWCYIDFFYRYRVLCKFKDIDRNNMQRTCERILTQHIPDTDQYKFGRTKIFCRAGQVAYLEKLRADRLRRCCVMMQKTVRAFICRRRYLRITKAIYGIQRYGRGYLARRKAQGIRRHRAAIKIQKYVRGWIKRVQYQRLQRLVINLQRYARGLLARRRFMVLKYNAKALIIQKNVRGWIARKQFVQRNRRIILCQSVIRRFIARRQYKKLRIEARSIEHVKKLNSGLENKIFTLQQKIEDLNKHKTELTSTQKEVGELKKKLTTFKALEIEIKSMGALLIEKNQIIEKLETNLKTERDDKIDIINENEKYRQETDEQQKHWKEETSKLRKELDNMNEIVRSNEIDAGKAISEEYEKKKLLMNNEQENYLQKYQDLIQRYEAKEQHCENLQRQLATNLGHERRISDMSIITIDEQMSIPSEVPEDGGYGSVRSTSSSMTRGKLDNINWRENGSLDNSGTNQHATSTPTHKPRAPQPPQLQEQKTPIPKRRQGSPGPAQTASAAVQPQDVSLVIMLNRKVAVLQDERDRLQKRLDHLSTSPRVERAENAARDTIRIGELELINSKLKEQIDELRESIDQGKGSDTMSQQMKRSQEELERRSDEIVQLKSVLSNQNIIKMNRGGLGGEYINEDGELTLAYETQKTINKQLELELQDEKTLHAAHQRDYTQAVDRLKRENERQQQILAAGLQPNDGNKSQNEMFMEDEIVRVSTTNVELQESVDTLNVTIRKLKMQIKMLTKRLKEAGMDLDDTSITDYDCTELQKYKASMGTVNGHGSNMPAVRKKEREYLGMFNYRRGDEAVIMRNLIIDLKPRVAVTLLPGLPAYILFMCVRHTDHINEEDKVRTLLSSFTNTVKKVIKKRVEDLETIILWFSNTLRLLNNMKQYSGDKAFQDKNTQKMNEQCLRNFDLSEYRSLLGEIAVWMYIALIGKLEEKIQPLIVPAILEHEEIPGLSGNKPSGIRRRTGSLAQNTDNGSIVFQKPIDVLKQELKSNYLLLQFYGVDNEVISQVFKQLYYFICASSLNNLLLRKELCHWSKGFQIRHNLSHFEMWTRDKQLDEPMIQETLHPIIQAAHLLQARKTDEDVDSICEMCSSLNTTQICKILNLYTPVDEFEQRVPSSFISKVQKKLQERKESNQPLLMDIKHHYAIKFPFKPSIICLEDIDIPEKLYLPMLEKV